MPAAGVLGGVLPGGWRIIPVLHTELLLMMAAAVALWAPAQDQRPGQGRPLRAMLATMRQVRIWRFGLYYVEVFGDYVAFSQWLPDYHQIVYYMTLAKCALLTAFFIS